MEFILQSSCHHAATKAQCKAASQMAGNLQPQFHVNTTRPVQIARWPLDLSQSAWIFCRRPVDFEKKVFISNFRSKPSFKDFLGKLLGRGADALICAPLLDDELTRKSQSQEGEKLRRNSGHQNGHQKS